MLLKLSKTKQCRQCLTSIEMERKENIIIEVGSVDPFRKVYTSRLFGEPLEMHRVWRFLCTSRACSSTGSTVKQLHVS